MDPNEIGATLLVVLLVIFAIIGVLAVVALIIVIVRFRPPLSAIAAVIGALVYGASPIDLIPEALVGPIGALDDIGIIAAAIGFMVTQIRKRRAATPGGTTVGGSSRGTTAGGVGAPDAPTGGATVARSRPGVPLRKAPPEGTARKD